MIFVRYSSIHPRRSGDLQLVFDKGGNLHCPALTALIDASSEFRCACREDDAVAAEYMRTVHPSVCVEESTDA